jgi:class 3 adenylate cyclase
MLEAEKKLERYFSPQVREAIMKGQAGAELSNSRKLLTVFVSDICNFSGISEIAEPEEVVDLLNDYFSVMGAIAFKYGGTLDKFLGDGMLVYFGHPIEFEDQAQRAVNMALEMRQKIEEHNKDWQAAGHRIQVSMGINTGYATAGNIGPHNRLEYTVIGNQVNVAFRLCKEAAPGKIMISQKTYALVEKDFDFEKLGEIAVKGIRTPITTYTVNGKKER